MLWTKNILSEIVIDNHYETVYKLAIRTFSQKLLKKLFLN